MQGRTGLAIALASMASAATAMQTPPPAGDVVVVARKAAERRQEARDFVRQVSALPIDGQLARWHVPVCPAVSGVAPDIAARVAGRIRAAATTAGAPVGKADCRANAFVVFTTDAHGLLATMERRQPLLLHDLALPEARALRASTAPVLWWSGTLTEGADGSQLQSMPSMAFGPNGTEIPSNERTKYLDSYRSSLISTPTRVAIDRAVVLIDVTRVTGRRLDAVADYAAFAILARVRPAAPQGSAPTILKLFTADVADRPAGLTVPDRAYLGALYTVAADRTAAIQVGQIVGAVDHGGQRRTGD